MVVQSWVVRQVRSEPASEQEQEDAFFAHIAAQSKAERVKKGFVPSKYKNSHPHFDEKRRVIAFDCDMAEAQDKQQQLLVLAAYGQAKDGQPRVLIPGQWVNNSRVKLTFHTLLCNGIAPGTYKHMTRPGSAA